MKTFKIVGTLVPAIKSDIFTEAGGFKNAAVVFSKSQLTGKFSGPRFVENHYPDELVTYIHEDFFYVLKSGTVEHPNEFTFKLILREAVGDDFKWGEREAKYFRVYFKKVEAGGIAGPRFLLGDTDKLELAQDIKAGLIYVPLEKQTFEPYQVSKKAS